MLVFEFKQRHFLFIKTSWQPYGFWVRVFGFGLAVKDTTKQRLDFSERVLACGFQLGKWRINFLYPGDFT